MSTPSLSIIIPCFNEEGNIEATVSDLVAALDGTVADYEMLVFDDCSTDATKRVIAALAAANPRIRPIYNPTNKGLGYNYRKGVELASKDHVIMIPGDNEILATSVRDICTHMGEADVIIPYIANYRVRPLHRQALSRLFTHTMNILFWQHIHYYNGPVLHKTTVLRSVHLGTDGFAYQAEILIQLLRRGHTYLQVPMVLQPRNFGSSRAFTRKNIASVIKTVVSLAFKR